MLISLTEDDRSKQVGLTLNIRNMSFKLDKVV